MSPTTDFGKIGVISKNIRLALLNDYVRDNYDIYNTDCYAAIQLQNCSHQILSYNYLTYAIWEVLNKISILEDDEIDFNFGVVRDVDIQNSIQQFSAIDIGTKKIPAHIVIYTHNQHFVKCLACFLSTIDNNFETLKLICDDASRFYHIFKCLMLLHSDKSKTLNTIFKMNTKKLLDFIDKEKIYEEKKELKEQIPREQIPREKTLSKKEKEKLKKQKAKEANKLREQEKKDKAKLAEQQAKQFEKQQRERDRKRIENARKKKLALLKK